MLLSSLMKIGSVDISLKQNMKYRHLLIDNRQGKYIGAAQAFNIELRAKGNTVGDYIVFCHQDIAFDDDTLWKRAEEEFRKNPNQLLGVAGMAKEGETISNLKYLDTNSYITRRQTDVKKEVETLDECCFIIPKHLFERLPFDEKVCPFWHLYAADYCYAVREKYDIRSYVLPEMIYHKESTLDGLYTDSKFLKSIWRLSRKYHRTNPIVYTPCYIIRTNPFWTVTKLSRTFLKNKMRQWLYRLSY